MGNFNMITALIINLAHATDRMAFMRVQMEALNLLWERIEAVTPDTLTPPKADPVWHRWQRPLRVTEMALCASHIVAWRQILDRGVPCLVLEDDAVLATTLPHFLNDVAGLQGIDHITLETRGRKKLVARIPHARVAIRRLYQDRTGSAAMVIWPSGAKKLLTYASQGAAPSDALISACPGLISYQADPALAVQLDQCSAYGISNAVQTISFIDMAQKPSLKHLSFVDRLWYRVRRVMAQIRMGMRMIARVGVATRRHVMPTGPWPDVSRDKRP